MGPLPSVVTLLFSDLVGSTALLDRLGDDAAERIRREHFGVLRRAVADSGGQEVKSLGDGLMVSFTSPLDALTCAVAIQRAVRDQNLMVGAGALSVRVGVHVGEPVQDEDDFHGAAVVVAKRLCDRAQGGQILAGELVRNLVGSRGDLRFGPLGRLALKGLTDPVATVEVVWDATPEDAADQASQRERSPGRASRALPTELTSFVGREQELSAIQALVLGRARLVTLTGMGGAGKTRLALRAATDLEPRFRHGAALVDLAPLSDATVIPQAIMQALGLGDITGPSMEDALALAVEDREILLVLDNCEHLVEGCGALVEALLKGAAKVRVVATSREPLEVEGEVTFPVPPLAVGPAEPSPGVEGVLRFEAVQLFAERAAAARPGFVVDRANAEAVASLCRHLDGLPLAIELAAARMRSMSIDEIEARLDDRFSLLRRRSRSGAEPSRHQTLRTTLDWSHELLTDPERVLFRRLSVFAGGWRLEDAEAVCADDELLDRHELFDVHSRLVDRSLVVAQASPTGPARHRFLETVRHYSVERLSDAGEVDRLRGRHLDHFLGLAETYHHERMVQGSDAGLAVLAAHRDNFRAALAWADLVDAQAALRLTAVLDDFWRMISAAEGWRWLQHTLAAAPEQSPHRVQALLTAGMLAAYVPAYAEGAGLLRQAAAIARSSGDRRSEAWADLWLGRIAFFGGDSQRAEDHLERARSTLEELGDRLGLVRSLSLLGLLDALMLGRSADGERNLERAAALAHEIGDSWGEGYAHLMLGLCAADAGDHRRAEANCRAALDVSALGPLLGVPLQTLAEVEIERDPRRAMRLLGAATGHYHRTGTVSPRFLVDRREDVRGRAEELLGADLTARALDEGRTMTIEEAIAYARLDPSDAKGALTAREAQVAGLVARGRTNREIAAALRISVRTAESHVDHILTKLGLRNRAELAAWATEHP